MSDQGRKKFTNEEPTMLELPIEVAKFNSPVFMLRQEIGTGSVEGVEGKVRFDLGVNGVVYVDFPDGGPTYCFGLRQILASVMRDYGKEPVTKE